MSKKCVLQVSGLRWDFFNNDVIGLLAQFNTV